MAFTNYYAGEDSDNQNEYNVVLLGNSFLAAGKNLFDNSDDATLKAS